MAGACVATTGLTGSGAVTVSAADGGGVSGVGAEACPVGDCPPDSVMRRFLSLLARVPTLLVPDGCTEIYPYTGHRGASTVGLDRSHPEFVETPTPGGKWSLRSRD